MIGLLAVTENNIWHPTVFVGSNDELVIHDLKSFVGLKSSAEIDSVQQHYGTHALKRCGFPTDLQDFMDKYEFITQVPFNHNTGEVPSPDLMIELVEHRILLDTEFLNQTFKDMNIWMRLNHKRFEHTVCLILEDV